MKQTNKVCATCDYYNDGCCNVHAMKPEIIWHGTVGEKLQKKPNDGCLSLYYKEDPDFNTLA